MANLSGFTIGVLVFCAVVLAGGTFFLSVAENYENVETPSELDALNQYANNTAQSLHDFAREQQENVTTQSKNFIESAIEQGNVLFNMFTGTITALFVTIPNTILSVLSVAGAVFGIPTWAVTIIMAIVMVFVLFQLLSAIFKIPM